MRNTDLSPNTLIVLNKLTSEGFKAYAVGGCVRDKLLGITPKDFDVVTNATPEQIKQCFKNCRLIGRRFRLAHIVFGRELIEVATFRGHHTSAPQNTSDEDEPTEITTQRRQSKDPLSKQSDAGQLLRDNIFGTIEEDAARRDFSFNAMYFDAQDESILDFANGMQAIENSRIEMIGNSEVRFREDPVRMIRAIRFACKLQMQIPDDLASSIRKNAHLLSNIPPARLFEEVNKLLLSGKGLITFEKLLSHNLFAVLFPLLMPLLTHTQNKEYLFVSRVLENTDKRINNDQGVTPAFLYASLLWYPTEERAQEHRFESSLAHHDALSLAAADVVQQQCRRIMIPKRFSIPMREIWALQLRLQRRQGKRCLTLLTHPKFRAAYDFLLLRGEIEGGELLELAQWWTELQQANEGQRLEMIKALPLSSNTRKRRRKRRPSK